MTTHAAHGRVARRRSRPARMTHHRPGEVRGVDAVVSGSGHPGRRGASQAPGSRSCGGGRGPHCASSVAGDGERRTFTYGRRGRRKATSFRARAAVAVGCAPRRVCAAVTPALGGARASTRRSTRFTRSTSGTVREFAERVVACGVRLPGARTATRMTRYAGDRSARDRAAGPTRACSQTWYPRGVSTAESAPALLRRALRHGRGRLAVLRAARPRRSRDGGSRGRRRSSAFHVKACGGDDASRARPRPDRGIRRAFRAALEPLELSGKLARRPAPVPPAVHEVARRARTSWLALPELLDAARSARRVPPPLVARGGRARPTRSRFLEAHGLAFVSRRQLRGTRASNVVPARRRGDAPRRVRPLPRPQLRRPGTSAARAVAADRFDWLYAAEELARVGRAGARASPSEADEVYAHVQQQPRRLRARAALRIFRGLLDEAGIDCQRRGIEPPPTQPTLF